MYISHNMRRPGSGGGFFSRLACVLVLGCGLLGGTLAVTAQEGQPVDHSKALSEETAPETVAKLSAEQSAWLAKRVLQRLHVLEIQRVDPEMALDTALRRNYTPLPRRQAMENMYLPLYAQVKKLGLFAPEHRDWWAADSTVEPVLKRILPLDRYPQYAGEPVNFTLGEVTEAQRAAHEALLRKLPAPGMIAQVSRPSAVVPQPEAIPSPAPVAAPIYVTNPQDHEVAGESLNAEPMNSGSSGIYSDYAPDTGYYYPPYYGGGAYYPPVRPPDYDHPPRPPRTHRRTSTGATNVEVNEGIPPTSSTIRRPRRPPPFDPNTMTRDEYQERYGVRP